jgi:hypothetical protein
LAVFTVLTVVPQQAEAGPVRVRFTPLFDGPLPYLDWGGVVDIDDGPCTDVGTPPGSPVFNIVGSCSGNFSFLSATLTLTGVGPFPGTESIALDISSSQIQFVQRTGLTPETFQGAFATPFAPVKGSIAAAQVDGQDVWFSLALLGGDKVQLYWFDKNPGSYLSNPALYAACGKAGDNTVGDYRCGTSANTAIAIFQPVPEPSTYALLAAGLGAVGFVARRRARRG